MHSGQGHTCVAYGQGVTDIPCDKPRVTPTVNNTEGQAGGEGES